MIGPVLKVRTKKIVSRAEPRFPSRYKLGDGNKRFVAQIYNLGGRTVLCKYVSKSAEEAKHQYGPGYMRITNNDYFRDIYCKSFRVV